MRYLLISLLICLYCATAQADPITINGTANVTNFISVFNWHTLGPQVSFDVLNTSPAAELHSISFGAYDLDGELLLPLAPGESRSFSLTVLRVPAGSVSLYDVLILRFQPVTSTPEPGSVVLLVLGGAGLVAKLRRRKANG